MKVPPLRVTWALLERFAILAVSLAVALPAPIDHSAVLAVLVVSSTLFCVTFLPENLAPRVLYGLGTLLLADLAIAAYRDEASLSLLLSFSLMCATLLWMAASLLRLPPLSQRGTSFLALPLVLLLPALRSQIPALIVLGVMSAALFLASRRAHRPLVTDSPTVKPALKAPDILPTTPRPLISVVIPSYNTGPALANTVKSTSESLSEVHHEIIVISDGSSDGAPESLDRSICRVILKDNGGKGSAFALGAALSSGEFVALLDSDGDIHPSHLSSMLEEAVSGNYGMVVGSKAVKGATNPSSTLRRLYSLGFSLLQRTLLPTRVKDSQVGCKIIRRDIVSGTLLSAKETGFLLDLEYLCYAADHGHQVLEFPVKVARTGGSSISVSSVLRMLSGTVSLWAERFFTLQKPLSREASLSA